MLNQENFNLIIAILAFLTSIILIVVVLMRRKFINWFIVLFFGDVGEIIYYFSEFNEIFRLIADTVYIFAFLGIFSITIYDYNASFKNQVTFKELSTQILFSLLGSMIIFIPLNYFLLMGMNDFLIYFILSYTLELVFISNILYLWINIKSFSITKLFFQLSILSVLLTNVTTVASFSEQGLIWDLSYVFNILTYGFFMSCALTVLFEDQLLRISSNLDETEKFLETFIELSPVGVLLFQDNKFLLANNAISKISGFDKKEMLEWTVNDILRPFNVSDKVKIQNSMSKIDDISNKDQEDYIIVNLTAKDGKEKIIEFYIKTIIFKGKLANFVIGIDITEKNELEEKFKLAFLNSPHGIVLVDAKSENFLIFNDKFIELFGYSAEELINLKFEDLTPPEDMKLQNQKYPISLTTQEGFKLKTNKRYIKKDGTVIEAIVSSSYIKISEENSYFITQIVDITYLNDIEYYKNLIDSLEKANEELKSINQIVSHDVKAPLFSIENLLNLIEDNYQDQLSNDISDIFKKISAKVNLTSALVKGILDYSGVGFFEETSEIINTKEVIYDIINLLSVPNRISIEVTSTIPKLRMPKTRVQQIFQNLISNAVKFNDKEKGIIKIGYNSLLPKYYEFYVEDNGIGIAEKDLGSLFQFFKTLKKAPENTGLGLAIVKKIVQFYGGDVRIVSEIGQKTIIFFNLPVQYIVE